MYFTFKYELMSEEVTASLGCLLLSLAHCTMAALSIRRLYIQAFGADPCLGRGFFTSNSTMIRHRMIAAGIIKLTTEDFFTCSVIPLTDASIARGVGIYRRLLPGAK
jgi:hypothetical protein